MVAICLKCGTGKNYPWEMCSNCKYVPLASDLIKSVYLSEGRFSNDEKKQDLYRKELIKYGVQIKNNTKIQFDESELERLSKEKKIIEEFNPSIISILFQFFLPAIILFIIIALLVILRYCIL